MNDKVWKITRSNGNEDETVTCEVCSIANDGTLLCFVIENTGQGPQPIVIRGFAPGEWRTFYRSTLRVN